MGNLYKDYYIILEVHYLASQAIIKSSYKQLSKIYHPDIGYKLAAGNYADAADCPAT